MVKNYPSLNYPNQPETDGLLAEGEVEIQEKLDGANFRFALRDGELIFGSRNQWGHEIHEDQFEEPIEYIRENLNKEYLKNYQQDKGQVVIFGEAMIPHQIDYNDPPAFVGFGVWHTEEKTFLDVDNAHLLISKLHLPEVPVVDWVDVEDWDDYELEIPESQFYDGPAEGVVLKNLSNGVTAKYVSDEFRENKGTTPSPTSETDRLAHELLAESRVKDVAYSMVNEGEYEGLQMEMMKDLPSEAIRDAAEEEMGRVIMEENIEIDTAAFRSAASSKCASVLRDEIQAV